MTILWGDISAAPHEKKAYDFFSVTEAAISKEKTTVIFTEQKLILITRKSVNFGKEILANKRIFINCAGTEIGTNFSRLDMSGVVFLWFWPLVPGFLAGSWDVCALEKQPAKLGALLQFLASLLNKLLAGWLAAPARALAQIEGFFLAIGCSLHWPDWQKKKPSGFLATISSSSFQWWHMKWQSECSQKSASTTEKFLAHFSFSFTGKKILMAIGSSGKRQTNLSSASFLGQLQIFRREWIFFGVCCIKIRFWRQKIFSSFLLLMPTLLLTLEFSCRTSSTRSSRPCCRMSSRSRTHGSTCRQQRGSTSRSTRRGCP